MSLSCKVLGTSCGPQPVWPNTRDFIAISELHAPNTQELHERGIANRAELDKLVKKGDIVVDIGAGVGIFGAEMKERCSEIFFIAVGAHNIEPYFIGKVDRVYYGLVPEAKQLLADYIGRVKLVTDTYGALSYYKNPMHALIYSALLLRKGGTYSSISSTTQGKVASSVLGTVDTWVKVKAFMSKWFHTSIDIIPTVIKSRVQPGKFFTDFIIRFTIPGHTYTIDDYETLTQQADKEVGVPELGEVWFKADGSFALQQKIWPGEEKIAPPPSPSTEAGSE